jgi:peroxiredoxin
VQEGSARTGEAADSLDAKARLVGVDWNDSAGGARSFIKHYRWHFQNLRDASGTVGNNYQLTGLPTTFILDGAGRIRATLRGPQTVASFERAVRAAT